MTSTYLNFMLKNIPPSDLLALQILSKYCCKTANIPHLQVIVCPLEMLNEEINKN